MHEELFKSIDNIIANGTADFLVRAAPRGNAKSTIISFALPLWAALYVKKHYILIVSDTVSQANEFLAAIKTELEDNTLLINDFGYQEGLIWTNADIVLRNDTRIQSLGAGKKVRGRRYKQYRPDLIIGDDLENDENVMSPDQRKKTDTWFTKALSKAGDERTDKIIIGTILHYDSLLSKLLKNPIYDARKYQAVIAWSVSPKWDVWEDIITNLQNDNRLKDAKAYFESNKEEMLLDTKVLWEDKENYYDLMVQRIADGPAAFSSEKQNEPLSEDERRFAPEWIRYYDDAELVGKDLFIVGYVDPSMGKKGGDYSAIIALGMDTNGQIYCLLADIQKRHPDLIISDVISSHRDLHYKTFGVEQVAFQEYFKDNFTKAIRELELEDKALALSVRGLKVHTDKLLRIQSLQPDIRSGRIKFKRDQWKLIEQLINFPSADHDDGPDALHGALHMLGKRAAIAEYYKEQANEHQKTSVGSFLQNYNLQRIG